MTDNSITVPPGTPVVVVRQPPARVWPMRLLIVLLIISLFINLGQYTAYQDYVSDRSPIETFDSGDLSADDKIALIEVSGVIMPPFTERWIETIEHVTDEDDVKGVVLVIDSPGGLVADSHQIYRALQALAAKKPIYVAMKRMAASGGYYIAMGAGPEGVIFAEPTTWTGSIGVIIPRYELSGLAEQFGVHSDPLTTGQFKDSLSPFKPLTEAERELWNGIIQDAFDRFVGVIDEGRANLDEEQVRAQAEGQVFTANQALDNGLIDQIGYEEDAVAALQEKLGLASARVVRFEQPPTVLDLLLGSAKEPDVNPLAQFLQTQVPQAMYFCGWGTIEGVP
jgi:protease-4